MSDSKKYIALKFTHEEINNCMMKMYFCARHRRASRRFALPDRMPDANLLMSANNVGGCFRRRGRKSGRCRKGAAGCADALATRLGLGLIFGGLPWRKKWAAMRDYSAWKKLKCTLPYFLSSLKLGSWLKSL